MLSGILINPEATLNNYYPQASIDFLPGTAIQAAFQLTQPSKSYSPAPWPQGIRFVCPSTAVVTFTLNNADGTTFTVTGAFIDAGDRSLISMSLTAAQTVNLLSGSIQFSIDLLGDGTKIVGGVIQNALHRVDNTIC